MREFFYFNRRMNDMVYRMPSFFPKLESENPLICVTSIGASVEFGALIVNGVPNYKFHDTGQCFPLRYYEEPNKAVGEQEDFLRTEGGWRENISNFTLDAFRAAYEARITREDIFYYVYGVLHSPEYRTRFASDLKKMLPRLPFTRETADFWRFSQAGRDLAHWHLNYETVEPWPVHESTGELFLDPEKDFLVQQMTFGRATAEQKARGEKVDKTTIHYNSRIMLTNIPLEAYDYVVNGKSAVEWIMERYQVTVDKDSGIRNDPNDWAREHKQPRYILDLLKRVIAVSMETMKIVQSLPAVNERIDDSAMPVV